MIGNEIGFGDVSLGRSLSTLDRLRREHDYVKSKAGNCAQIQESIH